MNALALEAKSDEAKLEEAMTKIVNTMGNAAGTLWTTGNEGVNNGVGIRTPENVDAAYDGMCELQILDHDAPVYADWLQPYQVHGSIYGIVPAKRIQHKPLGECLRVVLKSRNIWILGIALGLCMAGVMCVATFLPHALQNVRSFDPEHAGAVASIYTVGSLVGSLAIPVVNARVGRLKPVVIVLALVAAAGVAFGWQLPEGILMNAVLFVTGICLGGILVSLMSVPVLLPEIGPVYAGTGGGVAATLQLMGAVVIPSYIMTPIIGGNYTVFYFIAGALCVGIAVCVFLLPEVLKRH